MWPATLIGIPSIDLGARYEAVTDVPSYETRWSFLALALRRPGVRVGLVTADAIPAEEIDAIVGLTGRDDARERLALFDLGDDARRPLAGKLLARPDVLARVRAWVAEGGTPAVVLPFNAGADDRAVADAIGARLFGLDDRLDAHATKSGGRRLLRASGVAIPAGVEDVVDAAGVDAAIARLGGGPVVVKHDRGVTGNGNAIVAAAAELGDAYLRDLARGGVVEALVGGDGASSPSAQAWVLPGGGVRVIATHDQILGGPLGQSYTASWMPADPAVGPQLARAAERVGHALAGHGAAGRFAVDFVTASDGSCSWAVEVNLREGGTTHTHGAAVLLTGGRFDPASGRFVLPDGGERVAYGTDALRDDRYAAVPPAALLAAVARAGLRYDAEAATGVHLHLLRALPREGRVGLTAIGRTREESAEQFAAVRALLDELAG